jgi:hypothetical protein
MHPSEGEIRAHLDRQLATADARRVEAHLAACPKCRSRAETAREQTARVHARLTSQDEAAASLNPVAARRKLAERLRLEQERMERQPMLKKLTSKISRPAWAGVALVAVLAVALAFPQVRAAANSFLQLFRVEQVRMLPVDIDALAGDMEASQNLEALFTENVQVEEKGERRDVASFDEAAAAAGFPLRRLTGVTGPERYEVDPGASLTFKIDLEMARGALREMGRDDIQLPDSLEGAVVRVDASASVITMIGECAQAERRQNPDAPDQPPAEPPQCTTLLQAPSPSVSAPPEMDLQKMGELYLQVLGMDAEEAQIYASSVDWATTLVMPVPQNRGNYEEVTVDGVQGVLVALPYRYPQEYTLMWVKDGIVHVLNGAGDKAAALELAASLQ